ncbi:hypothetical protein O6R08_07635 [Cutibacterium equinum]|uniref:Tat pathway signal sequence domain protein n=1 Tax=Cutibacterium equinum TaxID=3016342 RepID=A0ABY7QXY7_9ACTN|nr:hypothetical protein [Cutibacterium equinum]WCC79392.1 hypothetical protein O6R08_07635 [Cutibacterium equinum]
MKNARELREPIAWTVIAVSLGFLVAFLVRVVTMMTHDHSGVFGMARSLSGSSLGIGMILLLLAAVLVCRLIRPATPHAEVLGKVSALIVAVAAGCDFVLALLATIHGPGGVLGASLGLIGDLLAIAVKVLAAWVLLVLTRPEAVTSEDAARCDDAASSDDAEEAEEGRELEGSTRDGAGEVVATREPDTPAQEEVAWPEGVGAVWTRAGDAASGASASAWDPAQTGNAQKWSSDSTSQQPGGGHQWSPEGDWR